MRNLFYILFILISACGGGAGNSGVSSQYCAGMPQTDLTMVPIQFEDNYALTLDGCNIQIKDLNTGCTRNGTLETNPNNISAVLTVYNKTACTDNYSDSQVCSLYNTNDSQTFFGCEGLGIHAYFIEAN